MNCCSTCNLAQERVLAIRKHREAPGARAAQSRSGFYPLSDIFLTWIQSHQRHTEPVFQHPPPSCLSRAAIQIRDFACLLPRRWRVSKTFRHHGWRVPGSFAATYALDRFSKRLLLFWSELHIDCLGILLEVLDALGAGNRKEVVAAVKKKISQQGDM